MDGGHACSLLGFHVKLHRSYEACNLIGENPHIPCKPRAHKNGRLE